MSYANITKENREPLSQQPHPDTSLLNTESSEDVVSPDLDSSKVNVVPADYRDHPKAAANKISEQIDQQKRDFQDSMNSSSSNVNGSQKRKERKERAKEFVDEAEEEGVELWSRAKATLLRPGVAGGVFGIVNVGLIGALSYKAYNEPSLRSDSRFISTSLVSLLALFAGEGYYAEAYRKTDAGKREEAKAREEGAAIYNHAKTVVLRPGVLGGLVGVLNVGVLGGLGYWSYVNWERPSAWDRRTVTSASVALLTLFAGEGFLGEQYAEKEYPKHK